MLDLSLPLQLAANLLALGAAVGFAVVVVMGVGRGELAASGWRVGLGDVLVVGGCVGLVAGHGLDGVTVAAGGEAVSWLLAGGLVLIVVGVSPSRLSGGASGHEANPETAARQPAQTNAVSGLVGPAVVVLPPLSTALIGGVAGGVGVIRLAVGGRATMLVALALGLWGAARGLEPFDAPLAMLCTIGGAAALGAWIWQVAASQLRAKIVVTFVITGLVVVAALTMVLSTGGAADLVEEEQLTLQTSARQLASDIAGGLPQRSVIEARPLRRDRDEVDDIVNLYGAAGLREVLQQLTQQDAMAIVDLDTGETVVGARRNDDVARGLAELLGATPTAEALFGGAREAHGVVRVDDRLVAVGGGRVVSGAVDVGEPPVDIDRGEVGYALLAGRIVGPAWLEEEGRPLPFDVAVEIDGQLGPSTGVSPGVVGQVRAEGADRGTVTIEGESVMVGVEPVVDPLTNDPVARVMTTRPDGVVGELQREQARYLFVLALLGAVIAAAVAGVVASHLLAPVQRLTAAAAAVGRGRLDTTVAVDGPDELGTLGRTFDHMIRSLIRQDRQLRVTADEQARLRGRLEALTASMSDGLVAADEQGRVVTVNPAAAQLTGQSSSEMNGCELDEALVLRGGQPATERLGGVGSAEMCAARVLMAGPVGEPVPVDITAAPVRDRDDHVVGRVLVLRDASREAEIERMKTQFLSNVSHELRTPLTPIRGFADVLARRDLSAQRIQHYADQIVTSTERLERVITRIVDFAALDSGRRQARTEPVNLDELIDRVLEAWHHRSPQRHFRHRVAEELPAVDTDPVLLTRCLDELIDNAVKFSDGAEPVIVTASHDDDTMRLTVHDRGVGFDPDRGNAVFGDFYQADASDTRRFDGLGLGLALVRRIVDELGGDAAAESSPGEGAAFHLWLPTASKVQ